MNQLRIPSPAGTYYLAKGLTLAPLVSALPAAFSMVNGKWTEATKTLSIVPNTITLADGDWVVATKTLSSFGGTPLCAGPLRAGDKFTVSAGAGATLADYTVAANTGASPTSVTTTTNIAAGNLSGHDIVASVAATQTGITAGTALAGDVLHVTAGTGVIPGDYSITNAPGAAPTSFVLDRSLSRQGTDLLLVRDIAGDSSVGGVALEGYLRNPARSTLGVGNFAPLPLRLYSAASFGAMAAATDQLEFVDAAGLALTGALVVLATSLSRDAWVGEMFLQPSNTLCFKTTGTTGWILNYG